MTVSSFSWTTDFATPATLAGLLAVANTDTVALDLSVNDSADSYHYEYLWEGQIGDAPWLEIGRSSDSSFSWYLVPQNVPVRVRVSDSNGALYSDTTEGTGEVDFPLWTLTETNGNADILTPLFWAQEGATIDLPLDQVVVQPLSGPDGDTSLPIVFTGQWQGERISISVLVPDDDQVVLDKVKRAALAPQGTIALKSPDGKVYLVAVGAVSLATQDGYVTAAFTAIRIV